MPVACWQICHYWAMVIMWNSCDLVSSWRQEAAKMADFGLSGTVQDFHSAWHFYGQVPSSRYFHFIFENFAPAGPVLLVCYVMLWFMSLSCFLFCVSSFSFSCFLSSVWGRVLEERKKKLEEELRKEKEVSQIFIHVFDFIWFPPGGDLAGGEMLVQPVWFLIRGPVQADAHCRSCRAGGGIAKVLKSMSFWIWWVEDGRSMDGRWWFMKWRLLMMVVVDTTSTFVK